MVVRGGDMERYEIERERERDGTEGGEGFCAPDSGDECRVRQKRHTTRRRGKRKGRRRLTYPYSCIGQPPPYERTTGRGGDGKREQ